MKYGHLGRCGLRVSRLCLGTWNFGAKTDESEAVAILEAALEAGITLIDTANHYPDFVNCGRSESIIGRWLAQDTSRRRRVVLATKVFQPMMDSEDGPNGEPGLSKFKIIRHVEGSLRRLQTDHIDLYQMHHIDRRTPWEEIWEAFELLIRQGKIGYVGSSNFPGWCLAVSQARARERQLLGLVSEQHVYNLLCRLPELEVLPAAQYHGIGVLAYSPLMRGKLSCKAVREAAPERADQASSAQHQRLIDYSDHCATLGADPAAVALAWILSNPAISSVVIGPRTRAQLTRSLDAVELQLSADTLSRLDQIFPSRGAAPEAYAW